MGWSWDWPEGPALPGLNNWYPTPIQPEQPGCQGQDGDACKHSCMCIHSTNIYRVPTTRTDVEDIVGTKMDEVPTLSEPQ